jgi:PhzF family phenazine biosynthesis protein
MRHRRFIQTDVFTTEPTAGNGLAVVLDAEDLTTAQMQAFAAWTNLAETTFVLPPTDASADYRVRIFTPGREMPCAGHPTLGTCTAWLHVGGVPKRKDTIIQECAIGLIEIDRTGDAPAFIAPTTDVMPLDEGVKAKLCAKLQIDPLRVVRSAALANGPKWQVLELASADDVLGIDSSLVRWPEYSGLGVIGRYPDGSPCDYEVRNLTPSSGMAEDPITGSLNAAIARWMWSDGRLMRDLVIGQGTCLGRKGRVFVRRDPTDTSRVLVGGHSMVVIDGTVRI